MSRQAMSDMQTLNVALGSRSYPIHIGKGLIRESALWQKHVDSQQILLVSNEIVAPLYLSQVEENFSGREVRRLILPDGETIKSLDYFDQIMGTLLEHRFDRGCCLVAVGGGVIGDLTGFAAACYQRGVKFMQFPTTLLAQVDSSVGGKTAVNHKLGKNMIGAFHQPAVVIADVETLNTLPMREYRAALAEIIKYGLIRDADFFVWLQSNIDGLLDRQPELLMYAIWHSCANKAKIVVADEFEVGIRAILNLGHTFGHAIETALGYKDWLHGEAVGCGILMAAELSLLSGSLAQSELVAIQEILAKTQLPAKLPPNTRPKQILEHMKRDKKTRQGKRFMVLLKTIGEAIITIDYNEQQLEEVVSKFADTA